MKYLLLIYSEEARWAKLSEAESKQVSADFMDYTKSIHRSGNWVAGDALQPTATATSVRVRDGKTLTTDGPFAETREQLGGFYLVEAKDLDEAIALAARIPSVRFGTIEVRPIMPTPRPAEMG